MPAVSTRALAPLAVGLAVLAGVLLLNPPVHSQPPEKTAPQWQYTTALVAATALEAKLNDWALDDWELVSVTRGDTVLEQNGDKTRLVVENYQLVARRKAK